MAEVSFDLRRLISYQGFDCIAQIIFSNLDLVSLANCRLVSKVWKARIDNSRSFLIDQLQVIKQRKLKYLDAKIWYQLRRVVQPERKCSVIEMFPEFKQAFLDLERNACKYELKIVLDAMKDYSKHGTFPFGTVKSSYNEYKRFPQSPLCQAIANGNQEVIKIFMRRTKLELFLPLQVDGLMVTTFLGLAVHNIAIVQLLLDYAHERGINPNVQDGQGRTAFHYACLNGSLEVVKVFLDKIPEQFLGLNILDKDGSSPLHLACIGNKPDTVHHLILIAMSMNYGMNINAINRRGQTLLHLAAMCGHDQVAKAILEASLAQEHEINVNAFDNENKTPFTIACENGNLQVSQLMIEESRRFGIDLNLLDFEGNTAMHYVTKNMHFDIGRVMIDESKKKGISLNPEENDFLHDLLGIYFWVNSIGGLVFGRRPDLWNPLMISSLLALYFPLRIAYNLQYALYWNDLPEFNRVFYCLWVLLDNWLMVRLFTSSKTFQKIGYHISSCISIFIHYFTIVRLWMKGYYLDWIWFVFIYFVRWTEFIPTKYDVFWTWTGVVIF